MMRNVQLTVSLMTTQTINRLGIQLFNHLPNQGRSVLHDLGNAITHYYYECAT